MASQTVIDSLIVKLGLDPRGFTDGQKKAAAETVKLEKQVEKSSDGMSRSMLGFAGKALLGVVAVGYAVKKFVGHNEELAASIRQLGNDADNYKIAAAELRNFGNIAEMNGGKAEDATRTVSGLSKAVYDLAYNGSMSDSLIMLGRLGVQFQDTTGNMRDFKSIVLDTQASIQGAMRNGTSRANAYQMLLQAGFDPGIANAMLKGDVQTQLKKQEGRFQIGAQVVGSSRALAESATNRSQAIDAADVRQMAATADIIAAGNNVAAGAIDAAGNATFGDVVDGATESVKKFGHFLESVIDSAKVNLYPRGRAAYEPTIQAASKKYGVPAETIAGLLQTESGFNPSAVSKTGRKGIAQLTPEFFPGAGENPYKDIDTATKHFKGLMQPHLKAGNDEAAAMYLALQDYNAGARGASEMRNGKRPFTDETLAYPDKVLGYASQATPSPNAQTNGDRNSRTDITFENVEINTTAKNGEAIATDFVDATTRKMQAAQADTGMQ